MLSFSLPLLLLVIEIQSPSFKAAHAAYRSLISQPSNQDPELESVDGPGFKLSMAVTMLGSLHCLRSLFSQVLFLQFGNKGILPFYSVVLMEPQSSFVVRLLPSEALLRNGTFKRHPGYEGSAGGRS